MKRSTKVFICCAAITLCFSNAYGKNLYIGGNVGFASVDDVDGSDPSGSWINTLEQGSVLGAVMGYDVKNIRLEGEVTYQQNDYDQVSDSMGGYKDAAGDLTNLSFLFNGYYDFCNKSPFTPFFGAGIGVSQIEV
ncbi:MAG: hypothetical protein D3923_05005, partial [Candidatus Electrothrix sp. AR3]|nr:hypothetical protein [Candidatus Electrothrix sp. AR3]